MGCSVARKNDYMAMSPKIEPNRDDNDSCSFILLPNRGILGTPFLTHSHIRIPDKGLFEARSFPDVRPEDCERTKADMEYFRQPGVRDKMEVEFAGGTLCVDKKSFRGLCCCSVRFMDLCQMPTFDL